MTASDSHPQRVAARHRAEILAQVLARAEACAPMVPLPEPLATWLKAADPAATLPALEQAHQAEAALEWVRRHPATHKHLVPLLEPLASQERARRASLIHLDGQRALGRAPYAKGDQSLLFGASELETLFTEVLRMEGVPLELDLGRRPRPMVTCAPVLPPGVGGAAEWLEVRLARGTASPEDLVPRLNRRLPPGLSLLDWHELPPWATPVADLCHTAHWIWTPETRPSLEKLAAFLASESFHLEKVGKVDGHKAEKQVDLRPVVLSMAWREEALHFATALGPTAALNPLKLLGAIFDLEPETITGLRREGFDQAEDPRLQGPDRFTTKLKNMYEDAVVLGEGSHIILVEDEDDEPLTLG